ncbi:MAG: Fic family protein [bacterium]|nr:Fic family protein [bacterium]
MIEQLEALKLKLDEHRPFAPELAVRIDALLIPKRIYLTNVFEDNTLTLEETAYYLETQRMIGGKLEREYREVKGLHKAISFVRELQQPGTELSIDVIKQIHFNLTEPIEQEQRFNPGQFRSMDSLILGEQGSRISFVSAEQIETEMAALLTWFHEKGKTLHPLECAARFHYRFSLIHPFIDGNGRVARLIDDYILESAGYGPLVIEDMQRYFTAHRMPDTQLSGADGLAAAETVDLSVFITTLAECSVRGMELMLEVIENRQSPIAVDLKARFDMFDRAISGDQSTQHDRQLLEEKETTKLALGRDLKERLKGQLQSKTVQFTFAGPAKFQQNNHTFSHLISEITKKHDYKFIASEALYEYHVVPNLEQLQVSGLPLEPFMKLLAIAVLSHGDSVGVYSAILPFEFGKVYITQENRDEVVLTLDSSSTREMIGPAFYKDWDVEALGRFLFESMDTYLQRIEADFLASQGSQA